MSIFDMKPPRLPLHPHINFVRRIGYWVCRQPMREYHIAISRRERRKV